MRGKVGRPKSIGSRKGSLQDEAMLSFRRNRMLSTGSLPQHLPLNGDRSRHSSADSPGASGDNDIDMLRPGKRRRKEAVISPVESNYSLRGRSKNSPAAKSETPNIEKATAKRFAIPGIEVNVNDESISPVSENTPHLEAAVLPMKQAMRISFNSKGGGRLIISNAGTPVPSSNRGSGRPSPAPGMILTGANTPEEVITSQKVRRPPGRRRNPHKDPKIEAAIRRQSELKRCYRTISRALRPILIELSTRGINELEEEEESYKKYPEYEEAMAALDYYYEKRQKQIDAQLEIGLKLNDQTYQQDKDYRNMRYLDSFDELQEVHCMKLIQKMLVGHRSNGYRLDRDMSEDDFDDEIVPLRVPDAYSRKPDDPRRNLASKFDSRSRKIVATGLISDHIGHLRTFDGELKQLMAERDVTLDAEYGPVSDAEMSEEEYDLDAMVLDTPQGQRENSDDASDIIALLIRASELTNESTRQAEFDPSLEQLPQPPRIDSFDALYTAIQIRETDQSQREPERATKGSLVAPQLPNINGSSPDPRPSSSTLSPILQNHSPALSQGEQIIETVEKTVSEQNCPKVERASPSNGVSLKDSVSRASSRNLSIISRKASRSAVALGKQPESTDRSHSASISDAYRDLIEPPVNSDWSDWHVPENQVHRSITLARTIIEQESQKQAQYMQRVENGQIIARAPEDQPELRKSYNQHDRPEIHRDKPWLTVRKELLKDLIKKGNTKDSPLKEGLRDLTLDKFTGKGEFAHLDIPQQYAKLLCISDPDNLPYKWILADAHIPKDAVEPEDRERFMEIAEDLERTRYNFHHTKFVYYTFGDMSAPKISEKLMKMGEERFEHALKVWPQHQIDRSKKERVKEEEDEGQTAEDGQWISKGQAEDDR